MSSKMFMTLSKAECLTIYPEIVANSEQKWASAQNAASKEDYGTATSLAIISVEELTKALIIFLDGNGFNLRSIKGIDTFFRNHQIRYVIAFAMGVMSMVGDELMRILKKFHDEPEKMIQLSENVQKDKKYFEKHVKRYAYRKFVTIKNEFLWFSNADFYRQDGFYCDYQDLFKSPLSIGENECIEVMKRLEKVRIVGMGIIETFKMEEDYAEQIAYIKGEFVKEDYYGKIEDALATVRHSRRNPFELIGDFFRS